jgi:hypothetical protein
MTIEEEPVESAVEFLNLLQRSNPMWLDAKERQCRWVFRGHASSEWSLTPSLYRHGSMLQHPLYNRIDAEVAKRRDSEFSLMSTQVDRLGRGTVNSTADNLRRLTVVREFEKHSIFDFAKYLDRLGLPIPGSDSRYLYGGALEIDPEPNGLTALAQHHGIATGLLDWTWNPRIAAFFALGNLNDKSGTLAVWAFDSNNTGYLTGYHGEQVDQLVSIHFAPRSEIGYLHAQEGLFTWFPAAGMRFATRGSWPNLEVGRQSAIRKLTLPRSEVGELARLLAAEEITHAHLMPTHDNITQSLGQFWGQI